MNNPIWIKTVGIFLLSIAVCASAAAVPELIEYNGTLAWTGTNAPVAGVHPFTMRLFDQLTDGTLLWEEHANVEVDSDGRYGVQLGAGTQGEATNSLSSALAVAGSAAFLELEVSINGQIRRFAPRQPLASVPFAMMAGNAYRASRGLTVGGQLIVNGATQAKRVTAADMACNEVVVTRQMRLIDGAMRCDQMVSPTTNEPVVFSTGVRAVKETRVTGNTQVFSMRKPGITRVADNMSSFQADTDCWLYIAAGNTAIIVTVDSDSYNISSGMLFPVPIPKGATISVRDTLSNDYPLDTTTQNRVFANGKLPDSYFMSLGIAP